MAHLLSKAQQAVTGKHDKVSDLKQNTKELSKDDRLTTDYGVKQGTADDWLKVVSEDKTGPALLEDPFGRERIHRFDHERIPERVVHARGSGAFGKFRVFESAEDVTFAPVLTDTTRETPVFVRFSTVLGSRGSADTVRDVRGFATKFYTQEGNWDLVGKCLSCTSSRLPVHTNQMQETTSPSSSSRTPSSSPMSSTPPSPNRTMRCPKHRRHTTTSGTSSSTIPRQRTCSCGP